METVIIVIHLMVVIALVGVVLVQRSEGGGLGIGGGSGFMSARGAANALTRTTAILATIFFATSLGLTIMARYQGSIVDILDKPAPSSSAPAKDSSGGGKGVLDKLGGSPAANSGQQPAAPTGNAPATAPTTNNAPASGAPATTTPATQVPSGANEPTKGQAPASGGTTGQTPAQPQVPNQ